MPRLRGNVLCSGCLRGAFPAQRGENFGSKRAFSAAKRRPSVANGTVSGFTVPFPDQNPSWARVCTFHVRFHMLAFVKFENTVSGRRKPCNNVSSLLWNSLTGYSTSRCLCCARACLIRFSYVLYSMRVKYGSAACEAAARIGNVE